ncbi:hypothetical protein Arub01_55310 [Actinomadura rubrobrunea]|uniref:Uncharacterized protein n=1 Tax=Actinomadura rubrobrunea TaxID=115335 RepID=A0A9W6Q2E2_9ACTN|nr:hypothetical protein [Actinomadura rubrobrunea]GLW67288.1 hypothetical protein Arub01_55310 [Actinomadura rubrobrunea]
MNDATGHRAVVELVTALVEELQARGLVSQTYRDGAVLVWNPAGEPDGGNPRGLVSPGLRQEVRCRRNPDDDALWWYWAWAGPTRQSPPDLEPLCPAVAVETAADRIAKVLAVHSGDAAGRDGVRNAR